MPDRITKTQRWLDLIALLLGRQVPLGVEQIMERVPAYAQGWGSGDEKARASARRMFERDKDELRAAGIPIETLRYDINFGNEALDGYRITRQDFYLPYLRLVAGDAAPPRDSPSARYGALGEIALEPLEGRLALDALRRVADLPAFPFADEARSARRKLTFDLDPGAAAGDPVLWVERPGTRELLERLRILSDALLARKRVCFTYQGIRRGVPTERDVAPFGLFFQRDWYLVGHDSTRDAVRVFRVARTDRLRPNARAPKQPDYEVPPGFRLDAYLDRRAWELGEEEALEADVLFRFPVSVRAERNGEGVRVEGRPDGSAVRRFAVAEPDPFLRLILSLGADVEILSPPELVERYSGLVREVAAVYGVKGGTDG